VNVEIELNQVDTYHLGTRWGAATIAAISAGAGEKRAQCNEILDMKDKSSSHKREI
jgi:hypothetical protein